MSFEKFFRAISYATVLCGFAALWISGTFGLVSTLLFLAAVTAGWVLEESRWQIGEKVGTTLIVLALPFFYLGWRYQLIELYGAETAVAGVLARMILALTAVKLLQRKSDRDWIFLYLMSFFEVLLAAGLSISALYLVTFVVYILVMVCAVIAFEIRKTSNSVALSFDPGAQGKIRDAIRPGRLPVTATAILFFVVLLAVPLFFMLPRVGGAGFGGLQGGLSTSAGFSDLVRLGGIGRIQQTDEVVMRVRIEGRLRGGAPYFRGVALDTFDNQSWRRSKTGSKEPFVKGDRDVVQIRPTNGREIVVQTVYLEPLDTPVIFAIPRVSTVQASFPIIEKDAYEALSYRRSFERVSYTVVSDQAVPDVRSLREDNAPYTADTRNYLQLPERFDRRITELATAVTSKEKDRYDKAAALENYLQNNFGYTLEQRAGGTEPLADFLFNIREGHCEYFATAMAVMLRTQGIASRVVNGFHGGEYNDAVDMTVVRQRDAHSWVEVYFPKEDAWVPFDPTPAIETTPAQAGIAGQINKYLEALETFWIQHFVAYDNQGQRSLARSLRNGLTDYQQDLSQYLQYSKAMLEEWWADVRGDNGAAASWTAIGYAAGYLIAGALGLLLLGWLVRRVVKSKVWGRLRARVRTVSRGSAVEFYERMLAVLADKGMVRQPHQTPLEFAYATNVPAVVAVTERYQRVRFGEQSLSADEAEEVDDLLKKIEEE